MILRGAFMLAALLVLSACADAFNRATGDRETTTTTPPARTTPTIARAGPARRAGPTIRTPTAPLRQVSSLVGLETYRIDALIGGPNLTRSEGDGELRIYRSATCILHVFAYPRAGVRQVTHIEARTTEGQIAGAEADACLAQFIKG
ncbi:MAG: hypothetical protein ACPGQM_02805 [Alphaproteobacteria bacterium]